MADEMSTPLLKLGDRVKIRNSGGMRGRIVELRGALGPGGVQVYRVRVPRKPKPHFIEVLEEQLEVIPAEN
jgi:hypothetical protein